MSLTLTALSLSLLSLAPAPRAGGNTLLVSPGPGGPPGSFTTIQAAIDAAEDGDTVALLDGTFTGTGNRALNTHGKAITLRSLSDEPAHCVIDGQWAARGLTMDSGEGEETVVRGITFRRCSTSVRFQPPGEGAGIKVVGGTPHIEYCTFEQSLSGKGGAIYLDESNPLITDCTFSGGNVSMECCCIGDTPIPCGQGGAIFCENFSSPQIIGCTFEANQAQASGGAIACVSYSSPTLTSCTFHANATDGVGGAMVGDFYSNPTIVDCYFVGNQAYHSGGAIAQAYMDDEPSGQRIAGCTFEGNTASVGTGGALWIGRPWFVGTSFPLPFTELDRCAFVRNSSAKAGAVSAANVALRVTSCSFVENHASNEGGALWLLNQNPPNAFTLVNCTLLRNTAASGGAISCALVADLQARNTIFWENAPTHVVNNDTSHSTLDSCFVSGGWSGAGTGNSSDDPQFLDIEAGDIHLSEGSPCIDTGISAYVPKDALFDIDGELRRMGKRVDVGADESWRPFFGR